MQSQGRKTQQQLSEEIHTLGPFQKKLSPRADMKESQRREIVGWGKPLEAAKEWAVKSKIVASTQWIAKNPS